MPVFLPPAVVAAWRAVRESTAPDVLSRRRCTRYGFWQVCWDSAVARYLDCGVWEHGFARVRCGECRYEMLVALSCKQRELCPSCAAKRGSELAASLVDQVLEDVGHGVEGEPEIYETHTFVSG